MGLFLGSNPGLTSGKEKLGEGGGRRRGEEDSLGLWQPSLDSSSPNFLSQSLMSNPPLLCLRFLKELGARSCS